MRDPKSCSKRSAAFDILAAAARIGWEDGRGLPALRTHSPCTVGPLTGEQSSSLPLCRLLHAYQAVAHSTHSRIEIHSLVPPPGGGGDHQGVEGGRQHSRIQSSLPP